MSLAGVLIAVVSGSWTPVTPRPVPTLASIASVPTAAVDPPVAATLDPSPANTLRPPAVPTAVPTDTPSATPTASPTATHTPTASPTPSLTPTTTPTMTPTPIPTNTPAATAVPTNPPPGTDTPQSPPPPATGGIYDLNLVPGQPQGFLDKFRLVTYYGSPLGGGLGILGNQSRDQTLRMLRRDVAAYQALSPSRTVLPGYHMVTTVANAYPPDYRHHVELAVIEEWVAAARAQGVAVILDIQPGRANVMDEFNRVRYLLYQPHVNLAIDPEFTMNDEQVPSVNLGQLYASQINEIQANMNGIGYEIGLNRVLILHQFADRMLPDKELIQPYPFVELVIDGDGFGPPGPKILNYNQYATEPGFEYGGFKLFPTHGDDPLMSPEWVMSVLFPQPVVIIYQ